jgi:hypothetical protein
MNRRACLRQRATDLLLLIEGGSNIAGYVGTPDMGPSRHHAGRGFRRPARYF